MGRALPPSVTLEAARRAYDDGRPEAAAALLADLRESLGRSTSPEAALTRARADALEAAQGDDPTHAVAAHERLLALVRAGGDRAELARALVDSAIAGIAVDHPAIDAQLTEAIELATSAGDLAMQAEAWATQAAAFGRRHQPGEAVIAATAGATAARRAGAWSWAAAAEGTRSLALSQLGDSVSAVQAADAALSAALSSGQRQAAAELRLQLALLLTLADDVDGAQLVLGHAIAALHDLPERLAPQVEVVRAHLHLAKGDLDAAAASAAVAKAGWTELRDPRQQAESHVLQLTIALARGDHDAARAALSDPLMDQASPPLAALTRARAALNLEPPIVAQATATQAAQVAQGHGAQRIEDEALHIAVLANWQAGDLEAALQAALALAEARRRHSIRLREVSAAAHGAARSVVAEADETLSSTGMAANQDAPPTVHVEMLERTAHGVRNALARVSACAELLAMPAPPIARDQLLERLMSALGAVAGLIDGSVRDAREGRGPQGHRTRLEPLAHRVLARYADEARERGIHIKVIGDQGVFAAAPPSVRRDAVSQLVRNAVLYCRPGDCVRVVLTRDEDHAVITVQDDGPGMPADRVAALAEGRISDAGLGISMVHRAVTSAGGTMTLSGGPGIGTTVELRLPRG